MFHFPQNSLYLTILSFFCSNNMFFIKCALKFKYQLGHLRTDSVCWVGCTITMLDGGIFNQFWTPLPKCRTYVVLQKWLVTLCTHSLSLLYRMTHKNTLDFIHQNDYHLRGWWIYKLWRSSLFSCLQSPLTFSHLSPNIFLSILLSNTHTLCFSLNVWDQVSHSYQTTGSVKSCLCFSSYILGYDDTHFRHLVLTAAD